MRQKLLMMLALLVCTTTAWAWDGSGTSVDPYLIKSESDWNTFVNSSSTGITYGGASRGPARAKNNSVNWDDNWSN